MNPNPNQQTLRGNKYQDYTIREPVYQTYYDGDILNLIPNETITGKYIACLEDMGRYHQKVYVIDTDRIDQKYDKIFGCVSLDKQMEKIETDTVIEIKYKGKNAEKNYHEYEVTKLYKRD